MSNKSLNKQELIKAIEQRIEALNEQDVTGINYWSNFKQMVENFESKGKTIEERKMLLANAVKSHCYLNDLNYPEQMTQEFIDYWTEHGIGDKKMRFEKEKSFGIGRRLATWAKNDKNWNNGTTTTKKRGITDADLDKFINS